MAEKCAFCDQVAITNLDGDNLCQRHADAWVKAEGDALYGDCGGEGWFETDDGTIAVCYGNKCH